MHDARGETTAANPSVTIGSELSPSALIVDLAAGHAARRSAELAVRAESASLTWGELGSRAQQVAEQLASQGIGRGDHVIVSVARGIHLPVAMLGTLAAGAAYVPVDAQHPPERVQALVQQLGARAVIADRAIPSDDTNAVAGELGALILVDDDRIATTAWRSDAVLQPADVEPSDAAYVIFTSGSTGTPNGVSITHDQIARSTHARSAFYATVPTEFAMVSSISFDSSLVGLFWFLAMGFTIQLPADDTARDADALIRSFQANPPSHLLCVPTLYAQLLQRRQATDAWPAHIIVAGEACRPALVARHADAVPTSLLTNEYGPTEGTIWSTAHHLDAAVSEVSIGAAIPGMWTAIVDENDRVVEEGSTGALIIGGPTVTSGYLSNAQPQRFGIVPATSDLPGQPGEPFFRTGDRTLQRDGLIYFFGRSDDQLSVAGVRIEPGEIEQTLAAVPGVTAAVVVGDDPRPIEDLMVEVGASGVNEALRRAVGSDNQSGVVRSELGRHATSRRQLVAHIEGDVAETDLRAAAERGLPASHRPARYVTHAQLPRQTGGKVDRAELYRIAAAQPSVSPGPSAQQPRRQSKPAAEAASATIAPTTSTTSTQAPVAPSQPVEPAVAASPSSDSGVLDAVCALFAAALHRPTVDPDESFFDLGGDSLGAFALLTTVEQRFGMRLDTGAIHRSPTPRQLAADIAVDEVPDDIITVEVQPEGSGYPIFMLHHVGVNARFARKLSAAMGADTPVFALFDETAVLSPASMPTTEIQKPDIPKICESYASAIDRRWPDGPIALLGHCQGGVFVHEVSHLLTQRGRNVVSSIVVNDWHAPEVDAFVGPVREFVYQLQREAKKPLLEAKARSAYRRLMAIAKPDSAESRHYRMVAETNDAYHNHNYTPYGGRVLVVRRKDDPRWPEGDVTGWGDVLSDLEIKYLAGEPFTGDGLPGLVQMIREEFAR